MGEVVPLQTGSSVLPDVRGETRSLRATWHDREDVLVVSVWRGGVCVGSVRLTPPDAAALLGTVAAGLGRRTA